MTPNRAREIADRAWRKFSAAPAWNTQDVTLHIFEAVLGAAAEERARCLEICDQHASVEGIAQRIRAQILEGK